MILEKRFVIEGKNRDKNLNVEIVEQIDLELVEKYIFEGMTDSSMS